MSPIRVGLIGLASGAAPTRGVDGWASAAHLPFLKKSPHFELVALLNSSVESAQRAITKWNLSSSTKAYGDPHDLANDPNVDLVVCSVRVDRHFDTVRPSLVAGKAVFVEWPLERNIEVAREMAALAAKHNAPTIVGLQASFSPVIRKVRSIIESGQIGRVLSSTSLGSFGNSVDAESVKVRYFLDRPVGGSPMSIHIGHSLETITSVLGKFTNFRSSLMISRPTVDIKDYNDGGKIVEAAAPNTVPDQVVATGFIGPSNAQVAMKFYAGKEFPGHPRLDWRIQGEKGWLVVTSPVFFLNLGSPDIKIHISNHETDTVREVAPDKDEWDELPVPAQNIARLYEAYRQQEWYPDFSWALQWHETIEEMWKRFDEDKP
ncbi:hypothetical protein BDV25DRAFT_42159 [Aspergillus avenaceus]|uniref:Gfo/Idh/MocA-like oxidoreductase N-terminal domain-containing protein n=1 Tax=Aspergillus avenaceus TaxID=36643 RepID=A0A5N6U3E2_ASPAV|nr:hypothetical protein BDV25DRAFT_42159 [Aspergillus avenaceus]